MPHLEQFNQCCVIKNIQPSPCFAAAHVHVKGPQYLPGPVVATGAHMQCSAQLAHTFTKELKATAAHNAPPAGIHRGAEMGKGLGKKISPQLITQHTQVHQHRHAEVFTPGKDTSGWLQGMLPSPDVVKLSSVLMSILKLIGILIFLCSLYFVGILLFWL
ncbi:uncharacterized protein BJ212DRAFT_1294410 [Suillus subaureus]|uniref:Uncharacterized protein n=1 Tax=Suillus subaureus TaxID=48587 RepID=A0A9P7ENR1_9AGAM|nr:uncharacterized protein BJ212DRAFT_1294410 [Suillus subaureus]KAG1827028.1 hypothetical protein BJ212DRAFT_1294410 [Suillus subaureus]